MNSWEDSLKKTIEQLEPSRAQTENIWAHILKKKKSRKYGFQPVMRVAAAMLSLLIVCGVMGVGANAATDGALFRRMKEVLGWSREKEQMITDVLVFDAILGKTPSLVSCSEEYIVFANERCMAIYDREKDSLLDTVDLQMLGCVYFEEDDLELGKPVTRIFQEGKKIYIFNKRGEVPTEKMYCYDMELMGQKRPIHLVEDAGEIQLVVGKWENHFETNVKKSYSYMPTADFWNVDTWDTHRFSEQCLVWKDEDGKEFISCILIDDEERYFLQTYPIDLRGEAIQTELKMDVVMHEEKMPGFVYTGDDKVLKTLGEYILSQKDRYYMSENEVEIPEPAIFKTVDVGTDKIIFGYLGSSPYIKNGAILYSDLGSGGRICRVRLSLEETGEYVVAEHIYAEDGSNFISDIRQMCEGYDVDAEQFIKWDLQKERKNIREEMLRMYVTNNKLEVIGYRDAGEELITWCNRTN